MLLGHKKGKIFMKKTILTLSLIAFSQLSFGQRLTSGAMVFHPLKCVSKIIPLIGSQVSLNVTTQALAPQYNVRGMTLTTKALLPNAELVSTVLTQVDQTAYDATFRARGVSAQLDKGTFTAILNLGAIEYTCK